MRRKPIQKRTNPVFHVVIGIIALAALIFFYHKRENQDLAFAPGFSKSIAEEQQIRSDSAVQAGSQQPGAAARQDLALPGAGGSANPGPRDRETYLCRFRQQRIYLMPAQFLQPLASNKAKKTVLADDESRCLQRGDRLRLAFVSIDPAVQIPWMHIADASAEVVSVKEYPTLLEMRSEHPDAASFGFANFGAMVGALSGAFGPRFAVEPLRVVEWSVSEVSQGKSMSGAPELHPLAETVGREALSRADSVVAFLDSRSNSRLPAQAAQLAQIAGPISRSIINYSSVRSALAAEQPAILSKLPKEKTIVVVAESEQVPTGYNFVNFLHSAGYRKIAWLRAGSDGIDGRATETPSSVDGIQVIGGDAVARMIESGGAIIIDSRPAPRFQQASIPKAVWAGYTEKMGAEGRILSPRSAVMTAAELKEAGDEFLLPSRAGKETALVFYGFGAGDWRPLKAAIVARDSGFKNVYWYRMGFEDWVYRRRIQPAFETQANLSPEAVAAVNLHQKKTAAAAGREVQPRQVRSGSRSGRRRPEVDKSYEYRVPKLVPPTSGTAR